MIEFKNVSKTYFNKQGQHTALKSINFQVARGRIRGIIGENGTGKTSLIRCANLLERPTEGEIWVRDQSLLTLSHHALRQARRSIGFIAQSCPLLSSQTVYDNLSLPLYLSGYSTNRIQELVKPLLEITDLEAYIHHYPGQLSGGQRQKLVIARALIKQPRVLLCDELTSALDPQNTKVIVEFIQKLHREFGLTILLITHDMRVLRELCDDVTLLSDGQIIEQSDVLSFFTQPQTELAKSFVAKALHYDLPAFLAKRLSQNPSQKTVLKIVFCGRLAHEPIMSGLAHELKLEFCIIQAHIETVRCKSFGVMLIQTSDSVEKVQKTVQYLQGKGVIVNILGYVD